MQLPDYLMTIVRRFLRRTVVAQASAADVSAAQAFLSLCQGGQLLAASSARVRLVRTKTDAVSNVSVKYNLAVEFAVDAGHFLCVETSDGVVTTVHGDGDPTHYVHTVVFDGASWARKISDNGKVCHGTFAEGDEAFTEWVDCLDLASDQEWTLETAKTGTRRIKVDSALLPPEPVDPVPPPSSEQVQAAPAQAPAPGRVVVQDLLFHSVYDFGRGTVRYYAADGRESAEPVAPVVPTPTWLTLSAEQQAAVQMPAEGPCMVTGMAGTGKTVVAVHRVKWLLEHVLRPDERVLFTTYTHTLVDAAKGMLAKICSPEQVARVDVKTLDAVLRSEWHALYSCGRVLLDVRAEEQLERFINRIRNAVVDYRGSRTNGFLRSEFESVILEQDIRMLDGYLAADRRYLSDWVSQKERRELWPVFEQLRGMVSAETSVCRSAAFNILAENMQCERHAFSGRYAAWVVDEAQDFGGPEFRFISAATCSGGTVRNLYIAGDGNQRIYGRFGVLQACGIDVGPRVRNLGRGYRAPEAIRADAEEVLVGRAACDMNGRDLPAPSIPNNSGLQTCEEFFVSGGDYGRRNRNIARRLQEWHRQGAAWGRLAVLLRNAGRANNGIEYLRATVQALNALDIPAAIVDREGEFALDHDKVKVMTMHRAKGLEFDGVVICLDFWPYAGRRHAAVTLDAEELVHQERRLLYMSIMRTTSHVLLTGAHGRPEQLGGGMLFDWLSAPGKRRLGPASSPAPFMRKAPGGKSAARRRGRC